jgi:NADH-quinone oxidoreductase subunit L
MVGDMLSLESVLASLVLIPAIGSALSYLVGRVYPALAGAVASLSVIAAFVCSLALWSGLPSLSGGITTSLSSWLTFGDFKAPLELYFDQLSAVMCLVITGIGSLIHIYSMGYMAHDESRPRFFAYLNLFVASMLVLVLGKSLPVVFIGWEGVGLCSYLLIGFWFTNREYASAGRKAFVMNRIGDVGFLVAMAVLFRYCGTLDVVSLNTPGVLAKLPADLGLIAGFALFVAATGKSAQLPLFTWLPDAMAGPTPVSALIHAATMVTAGIYLMGRMHGVIELDPFVPATIMWVAIATAALSATVALAQNDIKKVLAYSTVSQLGFMFVAVGAGFYAVALFHVVTHAFFKACLFLSAGSVIYGCHHEQDMRRMGGLAKKMPLTCISYGIATLAIAGIAPLAGYFSKHAIFEALAESSNVYLAASLPTLSLVATLVAICTALYMARSFIMTFLGSYRGTEHPHEAPLVMTAPVLVLALLSVVGGLWLHHSLPEYVTGPLPATSLHAESDGGLMSYIIGSLPGIVGIGLALVMYLFVPAISSAISSVAWPLERLFAGKYFIDELYDRSIVRPLTGISQALSRGINQTFVEGSGNAVGIVTRAVGELTCRATSGQVATYVLIMFGAIAFLLSVFVKV